VVAVASARKAVFHGMCQARVKLAVALRRTILAAGDGRDPSDNTTTKRLVCRGGCHPRGWDSGDRAGSTSLHGATQAPHTVLEAVLC
jgi:hypothetical protein